MLEEGSALKRQLQQQREQLEAARAEQKVVAADAAGLKRLLLQQTAIAEALQARMAAAELAARFAPQPPTEQQQQQQKEEGMLLPGPPATTLTHAVRQAALSATAADAWDASFDPKLQRMQELRAALAHALSEADAAAAAGFISSKAVPGAHDTDAGADTTGARDTHKNMQAGAQLSGVGNSKVPWDAAHADPKLLRIQQLTSALTSAAFEASAADAQPHSSSDTVAEVTVDAKAERIQQLRRGLAAALEEVRELKGQLAAQPGALAQQLRDAQEQLAVAQRQMDANQVSLYV